MTAPIHNHWKLGLWFICKLDLLWK